MRDRIAPYIPFLKAPPLVAVVRLQGSIVAGGRGLDGASLAPVFERAVRGRVAALALEINSPGGSAVQSSLIASAIRRAADEKKIPVYAFVEDVAASGGYWLATAGDEIWADRTSVLGSIGVISASFGAVAALDRLGLERRVHTAGESKSQLDPFQPENPADVARLQVLLGDMHKAFIDQVKSRRGSRLKDDPRLFTGEFWTAEHAVALGLADGIGHLVPKMKERFGDKVRFRRLGPRRGWRARLGLDLAADLLAVAEERAAFARFGL